MIDSLLIQRALMAALAGLSVPVYDEVGATEPTTGPDGGLVYREIDPPYVVVGETTSVPADTHDGLGSIETCTIHVWSRAKGSVECKTIMGEIDELLHQQTLVLDGARRVRTTLEFSEMFKDEAEQGETWRHGVMRVRARPLHLRPVGV